MKRSIMTCLMVVTLILSLTSCIPWEDDWTECVPLPGINEEIDVDPWDPVSKDDNELG